MCRSEQTEMYRFETANFIVRATVTPDHDVDVSFDDTGEVKENLSSGEWQAFETAVTVSYKGIELAADYLGGSIYADPRDFFSEHIGLAAKSRADGRNYGAYFPGMVREAIREARKVLTNMPKVRESAQ